MNYTPEQALTGMKCPLCRSTTHAERAHKGYIRRCNGLDCDWQQFEPDGAEPVVGRVVDILVPDITCFEHGVWKRTKLRRPKQP